VLRLLSLGDRLTGQGGHRTKALCPSPGRVRRTRACLCLAERHMPAREPGRQTFHCPHEPRRSARICGARAMRCAAVGTEREREHAESLVLATILRHRSGSRPVLVYPASAWSGRGEPRTGKSASEWYATRQREGGRISSPRGPHACTVPVSFYGPYRPTVPLIHYSFIFFSVLYLHERSRVFFFAAWSRGGLDAVVVTA
jgi:hypothetical protein